MPVEHFSRLKLFSSIPLPVCWNWAKFPCNDSAHCPFRKYFAIWQSECDPLISVMPNSCTILQWFLKCLPQLSIDVHEIYWRNFSSCCIQVFAIDDELPEYNSIRTRLLPLENWCDTMQCKYTSRIISNYWDPVFKFTWTFRPSNKPVGSGNGGGVH